MKYKESYDNFGGELISFERKFLFDKIIKHQPSIVLELGSGGGGATRIILSAMNELEQGVLYTCDPQQDAVLDIQDVDIKRMTFSKITGANLINELVSNGIYVDFVFFDGPEDPDVGLNNFKLLNQITESNCVFMSHDWETEKSRIDGNISTKSKLLRPYLHNSEQWKVVEELSGLKNKYPNDTGYNSVGMVYAIKE